MPALWGSVCEEVGSSFSSCLLGLNFLGGAPVISFPGMSISATPVKSHFQILAAPEEKALYLLRVQQLRNSHAISVFWLLYHAMGRILAVSLYKTQLFFRV